MTTDRLDYSKWDKIDDSEDDCEDLPAQIDKKSFQRYNTRKRAERDVGEQKEETKLEKRLKEVENKLAQLGSVGRTHVAGKKLEEERLCIEANLERLRRNKHWNAENICHVVEDRTIVTENTIPPLEDSTKLSGEEIAEGYADFCENHASIAEEFIAMADRPVEDCEEFCLKHAQSVLSDHAETYLMLDCLEKEMNGKHDEMVLSARQQQLVTQVREMARTLNRPPQDAVKIIFERFSRDGVEDSFKEQVDVFIQKIVDRAVVKKKEMVGERKQDGRESDDEEEIDPEVQAVLDELPPDMVEAFRLQDLRKLHEVVAALPPEKAKYYLGRCEKVGLWDSGGGNG